MCILISFPIRTAKAFVFLGTQPERHFDFILLASHSRIFLGTDATAAEAYNYMFCFPINQVAHLQLLLSNDGWCLLKKEFEIMARHIDGCYTSRIILDTHTGSRKNVSVWKICICVKGRDPNDVERTQLPQWSKTLIQRMSIIS